MHNNYYFLRQLSHKLKSKLIGHLVDECFSQNKDELIVVIDKNGEAFNIKAHLSSSFCCLTFPTEFQRARKNSVDLFEPIVNKKIVDVRQFLNERCFALIFDDDHKLLFKMHGNRSNIVLFGADNKALKIFNGHLKKDLELDFTKIDRPIDQSKQAFIQYSELELFPTFGKVVHNYLKNHQYEIKDVDSKWDILTNTLHLLDQSNYYIIEKDQGLSLSLLPFPGIIQEFQNPITAVNNFFNNYISTASLRVEKKMALHQIQKSLSQSNNYLKKAQEKLQKLSIGSSYSQMADIIMANLHQIKAGESEVTLTDFYNDNRPITIKLKQNQSPQKIAENYYRKAKNQSKELSNLKNSIIAKQKLKQSFETHIDAINAISDYKTLREYLKETGLGKQKTASDTTQKPFKEVEFQGYVIYIGKNSKSNDKMLQSYTFKDDLWLHAKDVSGSHVIIKYQSGKVFPKNVIERAAQYAAFHSKRKSDSLCPVIVTPRKFVRKRKGDPAGAVVVDKEEVILVEPASS